MGLIDFESDADQLRAEDEAIRQAEKGQEEPQLIPLGNDLADLIESISHDAANTSTEG